MVPTLCFRFENALREIDPSVSLPYFDSNLDNNLEHQARNSLIWTSEFLGNGYGDVTTGPFAGWTISTEVDGSTNLHRNLGEVREGRAPPRLMSDNSLRVVNADSLESISWFVDPSFETNHGSVHNFISGVMANLAVSPSDPVFFLHHAYIDCLWEEMRQNQRDRGINVRLDHLILVGRGFCVSHIINKSIPKQKSQPTSR